MKRFLIVLALVGFAVGAWLLLREARSPNIFRFDDVSGPASDTVVAKPIAARVEDFEYGGANGVSVLVTDWSSDWLGLVRGFKAHGIPFTLTTNPARALRRQVIIAYPSVAGCHEVGTLRRLLSGLGREAVGRIVGGCPTRRRTVARSL